MSCSDREKFAKTYLLNKDVSMPDKLSDVDKKRIGYALSYIDRVLDNSKKGKGIKPINTLETIKRILESEKNNYPLINAYNCVSSVLGGNVLIAQLMERNRTRNVSYFRFWLFWVLYRKFGLSTIEIGKMFNLTHSSVLHGINSVEEMAGIYKKESEILKKLKKCEL